MRRILAGTLALTFGLMAFGTTATESGTLAVSAAAADPSAGDCVRFAKADLEKGLEFSVASSCDRKMSCSLSWNVVCEDTDGKVTSRAKESKRFTLEADADMTFVGSAESCKQSWRIDGVGWACREAK